MLQIPQAIDKVRDEVDEINSEVDLKPALKPEIGKTSTEMLENSRIENLKENPKKMKKAQAKLKDECPICKKHYSCRAALKIHIKAVHEKIKRFSCGHCGHAFHQKGNMKSHIKKKHEKIKGKQEKNSSKKLK
jgi:C2H2-type zinc finger